jgi:predicted phosphoribosyltransferase
MSVVVTAFSYEEPYKNRRQAGVELAAHVGHLHGRGNVVVLGLPRGGVPVAHEVARALNAPLDIFLVRKLGLPGHDELAMGAIASGGVRVLNEDVVRSFGVPAAVIDDVARKEEVELVRRERDYRAGRAPIELRDLIVLLVDDGLATGATMKAAVRAVRAQRPSRVIVAVPVGSPDSCGELAGFADEVVCARTPRDFTSVGQWYRDFSETTDREVRDLLHGYGAIRTPC